jgi:DNA helicase HerA-like ATPase
MTDAPAALFLGQSFEGAAENLLFKRANRHGVVAGATGTGKTVTLQIMAQGFSDAGVPVFCADVKGDLSGISQVGAPNEKLVARATEMGLTLTPRAAPTVFWDLYGQKGHPIRTTVSEIGPVLMARMLNLNEVQEGVLTVVFHVADKEGLLLLDLDDLRSLLVYVGENAERIGREFGNVAPASIAAIQRALLQVEQQGGDAHADEQHGAERPPAVEQRDVSGRAGPRAAAAAAARAAAARAAAGAAILLALAHAVRVDHVKHVALRARRDRLQQAVEAPRRRQRQRLLRVQHEGVKDILGRRRAARHGRVRF